MYMGVYVDMHVAWFVYTCTISAWIQTAITCTVVCSGVGKTLNLWGEMLRIMKFINSLS